MPPAHRTGSPFVPIFHLPPLRACVRAEWMRRANHPPQRLAQVTDEAGRKRALPNRVVRIRRDQDGWNGLSEGRQALMQLGRKAGGNGASLRTLDWLAIIALVQTGVSRGVQAGTGQEERRTDSPGVLPR